MSVVFRFSNRCMAAMVLDSFFCVCSCFVVGFVGGR